MVEWGGTYDHSLAGRLRPASRPDLDGGARLHRTHLENPRSVSRSGGVPGVDYGKAGRVSLRLGSADGQYSALRMARRQRPDL